MKIYTILFFHIVLLFSISIASDVFTDYCKPGLCKYMGGDGAHSGCRDGILHDGKFQYPPCPDDAALIKLTESDKQLILDFHNVQRNYVACGGLYKDYRLGPGCRHGVVTWDKELEKTAFLHTANCTFDHDKCRNTPKYPFSGQNLGLFTYSKKPNSAAAYINVIAYLWYLEYTYTTMDMINSFYHQTKWKVGHFLTSLNERNNRVGCTCAKFSLADKKKYAVMLSCNYPTTNIGKSTIYNSCKNPASKCTTGTDPKYKFLCSSKEEYDVSGKLELIPYDGDGNEVFDNCGAEPELLHYERDGSADVRKQHIAQYPDKPMPVAKPINKPAKDKPPTKEADAGNPAAEGVPDYSEQEYDPIDSSSVMYWHHCCFHQNICLMLFVVVFNFIMNILTIIQFC